MSNEQNSKRLSKEDLFANANNNNNKDEFLWSHLQAVMDPEPKPWSKEDMNRWKTILEKNLKEAIKTQ